MFYLEEEIIYYNMSEDGEQQKDKKVPTEESAEETPVEEVNAEEAAEESPAEEEVNAEEAAEAAEEAPLACMMAVPRCCTVGMNSSLHQVSSLITSGAGAPSMRAL